MDAFEATQIVNDSDDKNDKTKEKKQIGTLQVGTEKYPIVEGSNRIGRSRLCSVVIIDPTVSKVHAEVRAGIEATFICDQRSSNGTTFKGQSLEPFYFYPINDGDTVVFGEVSAVYSSSLNKKSSESRVEPKTPVQTRSSSSIREDDTSFVDLNDSVIPGSQRKEKKQIFRLPGKPVERQKSTKGNADRAVKDSEIVKENDKKKDGDEIIDDGKNKKSTRDRVEDTEMSEGNNKSRDKIDADDIFDMPTQKSTESSKSREKNNIPEDDVDAEDIFDMETQVLEESPKNRGKGNVTGVSKIFEKNKETRDELEMENDYEMRSRRFDESDKNLNRLSLSSKSLKMAKKLDPQNDFHGPNIFDMPTQRNDDGSDDEERSNEIRKNSKNIMSTSRDDVDMENIYEMETQKLFEEPKNKRKRSAVTGSSKVARNNESGDDLETENIHEAETQPIFDLAKNKPTGDTRAESTKRRTRNSESDDDLEIENICEMATQKLDSPGNGHTRKMIPGPSRMFEKNKKSQDIHEMETQLLIDEPRNEKKSMGKSSKVVERKDESSDELENENIQEMETQLMFDREKKRKTPNSRRISSIHEMETQKIDDSTVAPKNNGKRGRLGDSRKFSVAGDDSDMVDVDTDILFGFDEIVTSSPSMSRVNTNRETNFHGDNGKTAIDKIAETGNNVIAETDDESSDDEVGRSKEIVDDSDGSVTDEENEFSSFKRNENAKKAEKPSTSKIISSANEKSRETNICEAATQPMKDSSISRNRNIDDRRRVDNLPTQVLDVAPSTSSATRSWDNRSFGKAKREINISNVENSPRRLTSEEIADSSTELPVTTSKRSKKSTNLDDSIAQNLGNMFGFEADCNDSTNDEPTQMMTQNLVDILKPTQNITHDDDDDATDEDLPKSPSPKRKKTMGNFGNLQGFVDGRAVDDRNDPSSSTPNKEAKNRPGTPADKTSIDRLDASDRSSVDVVRAGNLNSTRGTRKRTRGARRNNETSARKDKNTDGSIDESVKSVDTSIITATRNNSLAKVRLTRLDDVQSKETNDLDVLLQDSTKTTRARRGNSMVTKKNSTLSPTTLPRTKNRRTVGDKLNQFLIQSEKHKILFTGIVADEYSLTVADLGGTVVSEPSKATVLITNKIRRTYKFLCAVGLGIKIVSISWLERSKKAGHFLNCDDFTLDDPEIEEKYQFKLSESLQSARSSKLLHGHTIVITPGVTQPQTHEMKDMVEACGGRFLVRAPRTWDANTVIISTQNDIAAAKAMLSKIPKKFKITVHSTEFILTGMLQQKINLVDHKLI